MGLRTCCTLALFALAAISAASVQAAEYPERNITVIVPFPAGGASDMTARLVTPKLAERVTLVTFSEFGRTIKENGSAGTDHGTAGAMFVAGPSVKGGVLGKMPSLTDLAGREPQLELDQIVPRDHLGDGVLDLQPRVHLQQGDHR